MAKRQKHGKDTNKLKLGRVVRRQINISSNQWQKACCDALDERVSRTATTSSPVSCPCEGEALSIVLLSV